MQDQEFVTSRDVNQFVGRLVNELVPEQVQTLQAIQQLFDRTVKLNNEFDGKVAATCSLFEGRQSEMMAASDPRDVQLREHLDNSSRASLESVANLERSFDTFRMQLFEFATSRQSDLEKKMQDHLKAVETSAQQLYQLALERAKAQGGGGGGPPPGAPKLCACCTPVPTARTRWVVRGFLGSLWSVCENFVLLHWWVS